MVSARDAEIDAFYARLFQEEATTKVTKAELMDFHAIKSWLRGLGGITRRRDSLCSNKFVRADPGPR